MSITSSQSDFYGDLFRRYGDDPRALSHRDQPTQTERFQRMARVAEQETGPFDVHEIGCGLGHFGEFLRQRFPQAVYSGSEIHAGFVEACRRRFPGGSFFLRDVASETPPDRYDFVTLSGTFNIPLQAPPSEWSAFIRAMLESMYAMARKGISADFLTSYCDPGHVSPDLHYQSEKEIMDFVVRRLSRHFVLDAAGPLYEYTVRVYRPEYVRSFCPRAEFQRYFKGLDRDPG